MLLLETKVFFGTLRIMAFVSNVCYDRVMPLNCGFSYSPFSFVYWCVFVMCVLRCRMYYYSVYRYIYGVTIYEFSTCCSSHFLSKKNTRKKKRFCCALLFARKIGGIFFLLDLVFLVIFYCFRSFFSFFLYKGKFYVYAKR